MNHFFQYCTNTENFDTRFPDNSPTTVNVRYFIMHIHINNYKTNVKEFFLQDEETFGGLNAINLESKYWAFILLKKGSAIPRPGATNPSNPAKTSNSGLPPTIFAATTVFAATKPPSSLIGPGLKIPHL